MKNMQKALVLILCGALCAVILSCGTTGGGGGGVGAGVLATGEWMVYNDENDKGSSTAAIRSVEEEIDGVKTLVHYITGNVTTKFQYGFAGWGLNADEATNELYKTAKMVSFWVLGDGKSYSIKFKTSNVRDFAYFEYRFTTEPGQPLLVEVPMAYFMQPSWGTPVRKNQELATGVEWQTHESWRKDPNNNPFAVKFWGFKIHN